MTVRSLPPSVYGVRWQGIDAQQRYAARLLLTGYDLESAAALSGLTLAEVREIAAATPDELDVGVGNGRAG